MSGWKGTRLTRGRCPDCGRSVSGGVRADTGLVRLRSHNALAGLRCPGSGATVERINE